MAQLILRQAHLGRLAKGGSELRTGWLHFLDCCAYYGLDPSFQPEFLRTIKSLFLVYLGDVLAAQTKNSRLVYDTVIKYVSQANTMIKALSCGQASFPKEDYHYTCKLAQLKKVLQKGGTLRETHVLVAPQVRRMFRAVEMSCAADAAWRRFRAALGIMFFFGYRPGVVTYGPVSAADPSVRPFAPDRDLRLLDVTFNDQQGKLIRFRHDDGGASLRAQKESCQWVILHVRGDKSGVGPGYGGPSPRARSGAPVGCPVLLIFNLITEALVMRLPMTAPLFRMPTPVNSQVPYQRSEYLSRLRLAGSAAGFPAPVVAKLHAYCARKGGATSSVGGSAFVENHDFVRRTMLRHSKSNERLLRVYIKASTSALERLSMSLWFSEVQGFDFGGRHAGAFLQNAGD